MKYDAGVPGSIVRVQISVVVVSDVIGHDNGTVRLLYGVGVNCKVLDVILVLK